MSHSLRRLVIASLLASLFASRGIAGDDVPAIRITSDRGIIDPNRPLEHRFSLHNDSATEWQVLGNHVSCGCLKVVSTPRKIAPGETAQVVVELAPQGRRGRLSQLAYVEVAGEGRRVFELLLTCVVPGFWCDPSWIHLGTIGSEDKQSREVRIHASGVERAEIAKIEIDDPRLSFELVDGDPKSMRLRRLDSDDLSRRLRISWSPPAGKDRGPGGADTLNATLLVRADVEGFAPATLKVTGSVEGALQPDPAGLFFGTVSAGETFERTCRVAGTGKERLKDSSLKITSGHPERVRVAVVAGGPGQDLIKVTLSTKGMEWPEAIVGSIRAVASSGREVFVLPYAAYAMRAPGSPAPRD